MYKPGKRIYSLTEYWSIYIENCICLKSVVFYYFSIFFHFVFVVWVFCCCCLFPFLLVVALFKTVLLCSPGWLTLVILSQPWAPGLRIYATTPRLGFVFEKKNTIVLINLNLLVYIMSFFTSNVFPNFLCEYWMKKKEVKRKGKGMAAPRHTSGESLL